MATINHLLVKLEMAKQVENQSRDARIKIENQIEQMLEGPAEGSKSHSIGTFNVTVKRGVNRTVSDWQGLEAVHQDFVVFRPSLNVKLIKEWKSSYPAIYAEAAKFITAKPSKVAVTLKRIEQPAEEVAA